jgi:hypothetical protein
MRRAMISATTAALLLFLLVPIEPAGASHVQARSTDDACERAPEDGFTDTGVAGSTGEQAIDCIVWFGIAKGTSPNRYSPGLTITRAQLATMVAQLMRSSEKVFAEPAPNEDFFNDDDGSVHEDNINFVAKHKVVQGTGGGGFSPDANVRRDQMASFVAGVIKAIGASVPTTTGDFFPDDNNSVHEDNINALAALGIVTGRTGDNYEPTLPVTRLQMAFFLTRAADYLVEKGLLVPPDRRLVVTLDDTSIAQGDTLSGSLLAGGTIVSARLNGCGFSNEVLEDRSPTTAGVQFEETLPTTTPSGSCTLTFTATFSDTSSQSRSIGLTVLAGEGEAPTGTHTSVDVVSVDLGGNSFEGKTDLQGHPQERFDYDENTAGKDIFRVGGTTITLAQFEALLTLGDVLDITYNDSPAGVSTFTVVTDNVPPPANVSARAGDFDRDRKKDDVRVSWSRSDQPDAVYDIFRDNAPVPVKSNATGTSVDLLSEPAGNHTYKVRAKSPVSLAQSSTVTSNSVSVK